MKVYGRTVTWRGATREGVVHGGGTRARAEAGYTWRSWGCCGAEACSLLGFLPLGWDLG
ncbi:hypothetical protein ERO13_D10G033450v2 [Gossypium hirsutum]|uniref:Uncharacterized protein n=1 Tax=Gossypium darwinii TaxID=34276 RepID=A0A5D2AW07_GOSDA|nr:hypothetical protein ERO13_D10G033450v2 [Gossypium hirsutum]TYG48710.1 hypothetical protein ES288_D10G037300v1 [Gossypium darwinii]